MLGAAAKVLTTRLGDGRVLDLGCGTGLLVEYLAESGSEICHIVGLDLSQDMLRHAAARGIATVQGDASALPFADGSFDVVFAFTVLELEPAAKPTLRALTEVGRVLGRSGIFLATVLGAADARGFASRLANAGFAAERVVGCGQDVGYVCWHSD